MAPSKGKKSKPAFPTTDDGEPDILTMVTEQEMTLAEAAEAAGIKGRAAFMLMMKQEVEADPSLKISTKVPEEKLAARLAKLRGEGVRWERLMARTGLSKARIMELVASASGVDPDDLKRKREESEEEAEERTTATVSKKVKGKGRKAKAEPDEDEDETTEDDEVVAAEVKPAKKAKRRAKAAA